MSNWRLDDSGSPAVSDVTSLYDGVYGGGVTANQPGKIGTAYAFSGGAVLVDPNGSAAPPAPAPSPVATLSAWVNPDAGVWSGNIVYNQNPTYVQFRLEDDGSGTSKRLVYRQDGGHDVVVLGSYGAVPNGVWTNVVATVAPLGIQLFINGTLNASGGGSNGYASTDATVMQIGAGAGVNFSGLIDDVAIWSTVLSVGKIGTLSSILSVNGGALGGYNAFLMNSLFQVYDTGTPQAVSVNDNSLTWVKFTDGSGTPGTVTLDGLKYYAWFDATSGVMAEIPVPEIDPAGLGSVLALVCGALGLLERRRLKWA